MVNFLLSFIVLPIFEMCSKTKFWTLYKCMYFSIERFNSNNKNAEKKLVKIIQNANENTLYWPSQISQDSHQPIEKLLSSIPISDKVTYAQGFPDQVTVNNIKKDDWQFLSSAGTTGRMTVVVDFEKRDYLRAAEHLNLKLATGTAFGLKSVDIPPSACNVVCGFADQGPESLWSYLCWALKNNRMFLPETLSDLRGRFERQVMLKREVLLPVDSAPWEQMCIQLDNYLNHIMTNKVRIIRALPHFLLWLAKRAEQRKMDFPHVQTILPYGGLAGDVLVRYVCSIFQAKYVNVYGTGEVGSIGCALDDLQVISIYDEMVCLEIVDDDDNPVTLNTPGRVVVTDLNNFAMPIIRYDIGDVAEIVEFKDDSHFPKAIRVLGRRQECLDLPSGKCVSPVELQDIFFQFEAVVNFKIEQLTASMFKVSVVSIDEFDEDALAVQLQNILELSKPPIIKLSEFILPEQSGKFISVKAKARKV